jgi:pyridoxal phosphate enzyme (YggS family)
MTELSITTRLAAIHQRIHQAKIAANRATDTVQLLAVSKTHDASKIHAAWEAGQKMFGENYVQEAVNKQKQLQNLDIDWHFIGKLQSNKIKLIAENFAWVHTVSDINHARRLNAQRSIELPLLNVCIQVNISNELSKGGVDVESTILLLKQCLELPRLQIRGLMAIPEPTNEVAIQRQIFARLRQLKNELTQITTLDTLSMGMSNDLEAAIYEGATIVRIGTAIFGERDYA